LNDIRGLLVGRESYGASDVIAHLRGDEDSSAPSRGETL
jgi:hypothetical protein